MLPGPMQAVHLRMNRIRSRNRDKVNLYHYAKKQNNKGILITVRKRARRYRMAFLLVKTNTNHGVLVTLIELMYDTSPMTHMS